MYAPSPLTDFVTLHNEQFTSAGQAFEVRGINYYPSAYPWRRFLTESDFNTIERDFAALRTHGFNTVRLFIWHEALFRCAASGIVPQVAHLQRLDRILQLAGQAELRVILTLNDLADVPTLYTAPQLSHAQTAFLVSRYRDEAAILAWDVRNEGDIDYGTHQAFPARVARETVLAWVASTTALIRALDERHLITAGWLHDAGATAPYVDFVSFHHWTDAAELSARLAEIRAVTAKPILLQEFGYSTQRVTPEEQANALQTILLHSREERLLGWLIWAAFDFPTDRTCYPSLCLSPDNAEHYFGIWRSDGTPKPFIERLPSLMNP
jgi:endo-1,4-beta-mannosidase